MPLASHSVLESLYKDTTTCTKMIWSCDRFTSPQWHGAQRVFLNVKDTRTARGRISIPKPASSLTEEPLCFCLRSDWTPRSDVSTVSLLRAGILEWSVCQDVTDIPLHACIYTYLWVHRYRDSPFITSKLLGGRSKSTFLPSG